MICRQVEKDKYHVTHLHLRLDHGPRPDEGELLASQSHRVVLHARNAERAENARRARREEAVVIGDVETIAGAKDIASQANAQKNRCRDP